MVGVHPRSADVLCCAADTQITSIDIHLGWIWQIARHNSALIKVDVLHLVDKSRDVIGILRKRFAIFAGFWINDVNSGACGAEINFFTPRLHVVFWILSVKGELARGDRQSVFDHASWKQQSTFR